MGIWSADLEDKFLFSVEVCGFPNCQDVGKGCKLPYAVIIREIKVSSDWFGCVLVNCFYVAKVLSESVTLSSSCFTNVKLISYTHVCVHLKL